MARNGAAKRDVVTSETVMDLPVSLSEKEDGKRRKELEAAAALVAAVEAEMKESAAGYREQLKAAEADRDRLIRIVAAKAEPRKTRVRLEKDYDRGEVRVIRLDTGVLYETRPMEPEDHQLDIQDVPKHAGDAVTDKPPAGAGRKVTGTSKPNDVEKAPKVPFDDLPF